MSQEGTYRRLFDALEDFPAQAFLSRPGLLAALLDEVGTPAILAAAPVAANGRLRFEDGAGAMHLLGIESRGYMTPLAAMDWFGQLLSKLKEEVSTQFDGGLAAGAVTQSSPSSEHATVVSMMVRANLLFFKVTVSQNNSNIYFLSDRANARLSLSPADSF